MGTRQAARTGARGCVSQRHAAAEKWPRRTGRGGDCRPAAAGKRHDARARAAANCGGGGVPGARPCLRCCAAIGGGRGHLGRAAYAPTRARARARGPIMAANGQLRPAAMCRAAPGRPLRACTERRLASPEGAQARRLARAMLVLARHGPSLAGLTGLGSFCPVPCGLLSLGLLSLGLLPPALLPPALPPPALPPPALLP